MQVLMVVVVMSWMEGLVGVESLHHALTFLQHFFPTYESSHAAAANNLF